MAQPANTTATPVADKAEGHGISFHDLLEVINPLQHLPVISTVYRELTGDTISPAARIAGDALYGGIYGLASSVLNEVVEGTTGKDIGGHIWATLFGDDDDAKAAPAVAAAPEPAPDSSAAAPAPVTASAPAAASPAPAAASAPISASAAFTPPSQPTDFYQKMQRAGHSSHGVPLSASVPYNALRQPVDPNHLSNPSTAPAAPAIQPATPDTGVAPAPSTASPSAGLVSQNAPTSLLPPSQAVASAQAVPPAPLPVAVPGNIAQMMSQALDKYKAVAQQQNAADAAANTAAMPALVD